jgi:hypothetical protein
MQRPALAITDLAVAGLALRIESPERVAAALAERFGPFLAPAVAPDVALAITTADDVFSAELRLGEPAPRIAAMRACMHLGGQPDGTCVHLEGGARGWFDAGRGVGEVAGVTHLGEVDALLRLALSLTLPRRGALLLHGAAVSLPGSGDGGPVALLVGASGAGKSTAAAALGPGLGDELVVLHRSGEASGTPYWLGSPARRPAAALLCLARGGPAGSTPLVGSAALRALAPHVVRYLADGATDRAAFGLLAHACTHLPVARVDCPEGAAFVPFLRDALACGAFEVAR